MKVIYYAPNKPALKSTCAALGIFDGVHRGHQYLLKTMIAKAKVLGAKSMVVTFFPHPAHVLRPDVQLNYVVTLEQRFDLLQEMGVDICVVIPFTKSFASVEPEAFIRDVLVKRLGVKAIFVGEDFRFGRDRMGDPHLFAKCAHTYGYAFKAVKAVQSGGEAVSSTRIRRMIADGKLSAATRLLGRPFAVRGTVVRGAGRGKDLGYPTANVKTDVKILPPNGVYAVRVRDKNKTYNAVANLGIRPSFNDKQPALHLEVHIFSFNRNLYGKHMDVTFIQYIRPEIKFPNIQSLINQIQKDTTKARLILIKS